MFTTEENFLLRHNLWLQNDFYHVSIFFHAHIDEGFLFEAESNSSTFQDMSSVYDIAQSFPKSLILSL